MKIPSQKPFGRTKDSWSNDGDKSVSSDKFITGHSHVFGERKKSSGHTKIVYTKGKRFVIPNPSTHGSEGEKALEQFTKETGGLTTKLETL